MRVMMILVLSVAGCGLLPEGAVQAPVAETPATDGLVAEPVRPQPRPSDTPVPQPTVPEVSVGTLGRTVASLGNAAEPGMWLKTPLVGATRMGRVHFPATGNSVAVTLIPIEGPDTAGSRLSLSAMQALGAPLTDLVEVDVFGS